MKNTIETAIHNPKNTTTIPVAQVVDLGKASTLTLGQDGWGTETPTRPNGLFKK